MSPIRRTVLFLLVLALAAAPAALAQEQSPTPSGPATQVETKKVCMVNDALFEKDQIPVEVEGKTYYGCCQMCKARLAQDAAIRSAVDPVTGIGAGAGDGPGTGAVDAQARASTAAAAAIEESRERWRIIGILLTSRGRDGPGAPNHL